MITLHQGSILDAKVDVIVNPANSHLRHGGGLAKVIEDAARGRHKHPNGFSVDQYQDGHVMVQQWDREHKDHPLVATGDATSTCPGLLPFKAVIHAVGPVWGGGSFFEDDLLYSAHARAIDLAEELGVDSIAFPAISCGIFGFPVERAAAEAICAVRNVPIDVEFWLFEDAHMAAYKSALDRYAPYQ